MSTKIGIYPGSFDPITLGHLDIIQRSLHVVDQLVVAVSNNKSKKHMISIEDRLTLVQQTVSELPAELKNKIIIEKFDNLLVHYVRKKMPLLLSEVCEQFQILNMNF
jgi:pantetheine-phosphate adenylyltransferase